MIAAHGDDPTNLASALEQVTRVASRDVEVLWWVASVASSRGASAVALLALERIVALAPADPNAWDTHGEMLLLTGQLDAAEGAFRRALAVDASFSAAHHGLAMVRLHRGDRGAAIEALLAGIATVPVEDTTYARVRLLENLAVVHALAGHEEEAMDAMLASVDAQHLDDATSRAVRHMGRARLLVLAQQWSRAQAEAAAARSDTAPPFVVAAALAVEVRALAGARDVAGANAAYATLTEAAPGGHPALVEGRLFVALANGELDEASTTLAQLEAIDPYAAELASFTLAQALREAGRDAEARARLQAITRLHRRSAQSAHVRRAAAAELGSMG